MNQIDEKNNQSPSSLDFGDDESQRSYTSTQNKRRKVNADERLMKNRERNKSHARKTRERKKNHMIVFKARISELEEESTYLRRIVDTRYTASALLGLAKSDDLKKSSDILDANAICGSPPKDIMSPEGAFAKALAEHQLNETTRRVRRTGKYTPQEREVIRRERNRIHAKKTRDKKKIFLEASEQAIARLERDVVLLRDYMVRMQLMSPVELQEREMRDRDAQEMLSLLKDPAAMRSQGDVLGMLGMVEYTSSKASGELPSSRSATGNDNVPGRIHTGFRSLNHGQQPALGMRSLGLSFMSELDAIEELDEESTGSGGESYTTQESFSSGQLSLGTAAVWNQAHEPLVGDNGGGPVTPTRAPSLPIGDAGLSLLKAATQGANSQGRGQGRGQN